MRNIGIFDVEFHSLSIIAILGNISPPFIIELNSAQVIDSRLPKVICEKVTRDYSRIYWYEFESRNNGYLIYTARVRFAILNDGKSVVRAVLDLPTDYEYSKEIKALGTYDVMHDKIENLVCF